MEKNQLFLSGRKSKALGLNPPVACGDSPPSSGALGIEGNLQCFTLRQGRPY